MTIANVANEKMHMWIEYQGARYRARYLGHDPHTNIGMLKVDTLPKDFEYLHLTGHYSIPEVGTSLVAITCKLGLDPGPSSGLVSGLHTAFFDQILPTTYLRTSIPSDGGEGGAPVYDLNGQFAGMMVHTIPEIRSSFVVPARAVMRVRDDLVFAGEVSYGYLGIEIDEIATRADGKHLVIQKALEGSPAESAGILPGDKIIEFNDIQIHRLSDLLNATFFAKPGQHVLMRIIRKGENKDISILVGTKEAVQEPTPEQDQLDDSSNGTTS